jgi:hypothetical protein
MTRRIPLLATAACVTFLLGGCALIPLAGGIQESHQDAAADAAAKADIAAAKVTLIEYAIDNGGAYPESADALYDRGFTSSPGTGDVEVVLYSDISFCIQAVSASGATFSTTDKSPPVEGSCD